MSLRAWWTQRHDRERQPLTYDGVRTYGDAGNEMGRKELRALQSARGPSPHQPEGDGGARDRSSVSNSFQLITHGDKDLHADKPGFVSDGSLSADPDDAISGMAVIIWCLVGLTFWLVIGAVVIWWL